jgi:predicted Fe-S protein YdhL (DUF1289 family)
MHVTAPVPSPCTSVCKMDPSTGWCEGCLRTIDEIAAWAGLADADKLVIWDRLGERREQIEMDGSR